MTKVDHNISGPWGVRSAFQFLAGFLFAVVVAVIYLNGEAENKAVHGGSAKLSSEYDPPEQVMEPQCNWFSGRWVYDNGSHPLYKEKECTFLSEWLTCEKNGRKNLSYQFWRWQPHRCDLPRFNATTLMEKLRNKRLTFVGDSLNRGQWESLVCMVESIIPPPLKSLNYNGSLFSFKATEYNASIEFYWSPLLVESNSDDPVTHRVSNRIIRANAIEKHARHWTDANILVFNSYLWWIKPTLKVLWGEFGSPNGVYKDVEGIRAFEMATQTWSDWLDIHVNKSKTQIFWASSSPSHESSEEWGGASGSNCYNETQPIWKENYQGSRSISNMMQVVETAIGNLRTKRNLTVTLLNITQLSEYRKDGHLSVYRNLKDPLTKEQLANPSSYADCFHWCLPGVPDTWNEILFAHLLNL